LVLDGSAPGYALPGKVKSGGRKSAVERAIKRTLRTGVLSFAAPDVMKQGRKERIEVGIARQERDAPALDTQFRTKHERVNEAVQTAEFMTVELVGDAFEIAALSPPTQPVASTAHWEFEVTPLRAGAQTLTLKGTSLITIDGVERTIAVPAFDRGIRVEVDVAYGIRRFFGTNWQWIVGTLVGLGGAIGAWLALFH
jgi:hypothetical protein